MWMLTGYLETLPRDMDEAAMTDGASRVGAFYRVTLPMAAPGIAAVGTFTYMTAWGEVLFAAVLTDDATRTRPIGLRTYEDAQGLTFHWDQLMSASLTISVPIIVAFLALQRYFVRGLSSGALK